MKILLSTVVDSLSYQRNPGIASVARGGRWGVSLSIFILIVASVDLLEKETMYVELGNEYVPNNL